MLHYAQELRYIDENIKEIIHITYNLLNISFPETSMSDLVQYLHATETSFWALAFTWSIIENPVE